MFGHQLWLLSSNTRSACKSGFTTSPLDVPQNLHIAGVGHDVKASAGAKYEPGKLDSSSQSGRSQGYYKMKLNIPTTRVATALPSLLQVAMRLIVGKGGTELGAVCHLELLQGRGQARKVKLSIRFTFSGSGFRAPWLGVGLQSAAQYIHLYTTRVRESLRLQVLWVAGWASYSVFGTLSAWHSHVAQDYTIHAPVSCIHPYPSSLRITKRLWRILLNSMVQGGGSP